MQYIQGKDRNQCVLFSESLDSLIDQDHEIRFIDLFVESIDVVEFGFKIKSNSIEGRPPYHPKDLLKLFIYGYLNSMRSSRILEKECKRNVEVMWLIRQLTPDHNTISNFRRDNEKAIRKVFRYTVSIAKQFDLIGGKLIAGDSTKLRAQNSKKNNFNDKKITQHLEYIEKKLNDYNQALATADEDNKIIIQQEIDKHTERKLKYNSLQDQLEQTDEKQISTTDPDSRQLLVRNNITEVAYNVQTTVDAKNMITIDYKVTNQNDSKAMGCMLRRAEVILQSSDFTALYDKGYHTGSELKIGFQRGIELMVAVPAVSSVAPHPDFKMDKFLYDSQKDTYTCPAGQTLTSNGNNYIKNKERYSYYIKHYKTKACSSCPVKQLCTKNERGRLIERSEYQEYLDKNNVNIEANPKTYRKRQAIIEHTYGIVKRQWGFYYIMTKFGKRRASADVGMIFTAFNLRRIMNIVSKNELRVYLKQLCSTLLSEIVFKFEHIFVTAKNYFIPKIHRQNIYFIKGLSKRFELSL